MDLPLTDLHPPTIGDGRYSLIAPVGEGGMAFVCSATDTLLAVPRAIKVLLPDFARRKVLRARFESEAQVMAQLEHPNIVRVYDVGTRGALPFIAMELLTGGSLATWLEAFGPMPPRMACRSVHQLCLGVAAAHAADVIHRDIKPHNVLIAADGTCKLTDFGIAQVAQGSTTRTGHTMGTLGYMAPEQHTNAKDVDARSDVYSIGVTLWKLLTDGPTENVAHEVATHGLRGCPEPIHDVLTRCLAYDRNDRYPTVTRLMVDLAKAIQKLPADPPDTPPLPHQAQMRAMNEDSGMSFDTILPLIDRSLEPAPAPVRRTAPIDATFAATPPAATPPAATPPPRERSENPDLPDYIDQDALHAPSTGFVVSLTDEDIDATLEARRLRAEWEASGREGPPPESSRLSAAEAKESPGILAMLLRAVGGVTTLMLITIVPVVLLTIGLFSARYFDEQARQERSAATYTFAVQLFATEGPAAIRARKAEGSKNPELERLYFEMEEAKGPKKLKVAERFVVATEEDLEASLPEDPTQMTPVQAEEVKRVLRMRAALDAYNQAHRAENPTTPKP